MAECSRLVLYQRCIHSELPLSFPLIVESLFLRLGGVGLFVFYWWDLADGRVQSLGVVPAVYSQGDLLAGLGSGGPAAAVGELVGEGGEERLWRRVVQRGACAPGGALDAEPPAGGGEGI